jgi:hypothetical protein
MSDANNCIELYKVDITNIKSFINSLTDEDWDAWKHRQNSYNPHSKTKTYPLSWVEVEHLNGNNSLNITIKNTFSKIWDILSPELTKLEKYYRGRCTNVMFVKLLPGEKINPHVDVRHLLHFYRCHLPIVTNDDIFFYIDYRKYKLREGIFYKINNFRVHSVENNSTEDRIHLIVDILPYSNNINVKFTCE